MTNCRFFSGYKPCGKHPQCADSCPHFATASPRILIVHLEALGAVLRATAILPALHRQYPKAHITWVTQAPADQLLKPNALIDRVLTTSANDQLVLRSLEFDLALVADKSLKAAGVLKLTRAQEVRGFIVDSKSGAILPANLEAEELWQIGLSDEKKFRSNQKPETQLLHEALALGAWLRDPYRVELSQDEQTLVERRRRQWSLGLQQIIGINTGCSGVIPYKRFTVSYQRDLVKALQAKFRQPIVLLGGPEDEARNQEIAHGLHVIASPTTLGLRDGICSVAACDVVISGDSLGMHMGIALKKWVVAWFGPTCAQEIDLYDSGEKLIAEVDCGPCWKRSCSKPTMCYDRVPIPAVIDATARGLNWKTSLSKQPFLATSSLLSP